MPTDRPFVSTLIDSRAFWQVCLCALVAAVGFLALTPTPPTVFDSGWDKLNHALAFTALAWSGYLGFGGSRRRTWSLAIGLLAFGALIEAVQSIVPGRAGQWSDLLADCLGIGAGTAIAMLFSRAAASR